jgi:hypothetical protein
MLCHGPKLEREQLLLGRFVDIGTELFAMTAACLRGERLFNSANSRDKKEELPGLIDYFCRTTRLRIEQHFRGVRCNTDPIGYRFAQNVLAGRLMELETGIVQTRK